MSQIEMMGGERTVCLEHSLLSAHSENIHAMKTNTAFSYWIVPIESSLPGHLTNSRHTSTCLRNFQS